MKRLGWLASAIVLGFGLAACGSSGSSGAQPSGSSAPRTAVLTGTTSLGAVLADYRRHTIYALSSDTTTSTCTGACRSVWPPVTVTGSATGPLSAGVTATLGTIPGSGGTRQVTAAGHPLYTYAGDTGSGQANGQGISSFGGTWHAVSPAGAPITGAGASPSPTSTYSYHY